MFSLIYRTCTTQYKVYSTKYTIFAASTNRINLIGMCENNTSKKRGKAAN